MIPAPLKPCHGFCIGIFLLICTQSLANADETPPLPELDWQWNGTDREMSWSHGLLESTSSLSGAWQSHPEALSPLIPSLDRERQFFRIVTATGSARRQAHLTTSGGSSHLNGITAILDQYLPAIPDINGALNLANLFQGQHLLEIRHPWYDTHTHKFAVTTEFSFEALTIPSPNYIGKAFPLNEICYRAVGHAGGSPTGGYNSLASCIDARSKGVFWMEVDTLFAADGIPVAFHDWPLMQREFGLTETATSIKIAEAGIMTTPALLNSFSHLILDLIHNPSQDIKNIVDYLDANYPERIRSDVVLQIFTRENYDYIRSIDPAIRISFNLASWSTTSPYGNFWREALADVFAATDFYVINPNSMIDVELIEYLEANGLQNTFVAVMNDHDSIEINRLTQLRSIPMLWDMSLAPESISE